MKLAIIQAHEHHDVALAGEKNCGGQNTAERGGWILGVTWADSAGRHGIPRDEVLYAIANAHHVVTGFGSSRAGAEPVTLFIGPSRMGTLEVLVALRSPRSIWVFHAMPLRAATAQAADYQGI